MLNEVLCVALKYYDKGLWPLPLLPEQKKPAIKWEPYQKNPPTKEEVTSWFARYPDRNIAIVTGKTTNITVVDVDSEKGKEVIDGLIPDSMTVPIAKSPKGWHYYFKHVEGLRNGVKVLTDCDIRAQGGYIVVPPSHNGNDTFYSWMPELSLFDVDPPCMPDLLNKTILQKNTPKNDREKTNLVKVSQKIFTEGYRDDTLFHIANCLFKGGMPDIEVCNILKFIASNCIPPFPEKEAMEKIKSVLSRIERQERNISQEVREWVLVSDGQFLVKDVQMELRLVNKNQSHVCNVVLADLAKEGLIERVGPKRGCYRLIDKECDDIDFVNVDFKSVPIKLPFNIHDLVEIMPGNIITVMGEVGAGKTAYLLNTAKMNMNIFNVYYFSSEMGALEMNKRLRKFDFPLSDWKIKAKAKSSSFADVIVPGEGNINIIDFLEIYDNFYEVGGKLNNIHEKLNGAIAVIGVQKNPGRDVGLGGQRSLEKPRLALAMSPGELKIVKAKNWKTELNPNNMEFKFKIINGCKFIEKDNDPFN